MNGQMSPNLQPIMEEGATNNNKKKKKGKNEESKKDSDEEEEQKEEKKKQIEMKDLVAENFVLLTEIGKGAFGKIILTYNMRDDV